MSRRCYLEVLCDECGVLARFETLSTEPLVATLNPNEMILRQGWQTRPIEGSSFQVRDTCPACLARAVKKGKNHVHAET